MGVAQRGMTDFHLIRYGKRTFRPADARAIHLHGHTHESFNYVMNGTRIVCNPRGYFPMELNTAFDPSLTVELRVQPKKPDG